MINKNHKNQLFTEIIVALNKMKEYHSNEPELNQLVDEHISGIFKYLKKH